MIEEGRSSSSISTLHLRERGEKNLNSSSLSSFDNAFLTENVGSWGGGGKLLSRRSSLDGLFSLISLFSSLRTACVCVCDAKGASEWGEEERCDQVHPAAASANPECNGHFFFPALTSFALRNVTLQSILE